MANQCFVLAPYGSPFDEYYRGVLSPAIKAAGLEPIRADEIYGPRPIIEDIVESIRNAEALVADVTGRNPNVNYELGLAHAFGRTVVIISQTIDDIPFDYRHLRAIIYNTQEFDWTLQLGSKITKSLENRHAAHSLAWPQRKAERGNEEGAPSSWIRKQWVAHRWWKVGLIAIIIGAGFLAAWRAAPEEVRSRVLGKVGAEPELPDPVNNSPADWKGIKRTDVVDLDLYSRVPAHLLEKRVSPTLRRVEAKIQRLRTSARKFSNWQFSSRMPVDTVCLSGQAFEFRKVKDLPVYGAQLLHRSELLIYLGAAPLNQDITLRWQTVSWNKFQESQNWWTSIVLDIPYDHLVLVVDFPVESGLHIKNMHPRTRRVGTAVWKDFSAPMLTENAGDKIRWEIGRAEPGIEYALHWDGPIMAPQRANAYPDRRARGGQVPQKKE